MRISIVYRHVSEYQDHANRLAAEIRKTKGIDAELIRGEGFDVRLNGDLIYSMAHTGRLPQFSDLLGYISKC